MVCERCRKECKSFSCSWFNTQMICSECSKREEQHPMYEEAKRIENEHVKKGNYNFEGIGYRD